MSERAYEFDTEAEARAFALGIELVNDSALSVASLEVGSDGSSVVVVLDTDGDEDDGS